MKWLVSFCIMNIPPTSAAPISANSGTCAGRWVPAAQPTEPVFGLDADDGRYAAQPTSWNDLNWAQLATDSAAREALGYIDLDADLPDTSLVVTEPDDPPLAWHAEHGRGPSGANASDLAYVSLQRPFRVAIHGSDM